MRSGWGRSSVVAAGQGSDCGGMVAVVGKGAVSGVDSCTRMGVGSGVPSVAGSPMGGVEVATTGCRIQAYNGRIHTVPLDSPSSGYFCK